MDPIAFSIGNIDIYWYGILVAIAFLLGYLNTLSNVRRYGLDENVVGDLLFKLAITVIIGAKLGAVVPELGYYIKHPLEIFSRAGLGSHGAIITTMVMGYYWTKRPTCRIG